MTDAFKYREEFESALPWYVNGTLDMRGRLRVERYLEDHPEHAEDLRWHEEMRRTVRNAPSQIPTDLGWEEFSRHAGLSAATHVPRSRSLRVLVAKRWAALATAAARPAFSTLAVAALLLQTGIIAALLIGHRQDDHGQESADFSAQRLAEPKASAAASMLRVRFKPSSTELEIRKLLFGLDARIVDGPNQLGDYVVSTPNDRFPAAQKALAGNPLVEMVSVLASMPGR